MTNPLFFVSNVSKVEIELKPQQFDSRPFSVCIDNNTRVGDVIYKAAYHLDVISYSQEIPNNDDYSHRTMYDVLNGFNPTQYCLQTNTDAATFVKTHSLHEVGGNFGERRLRNEAFVLAIHVENPTAGWELRCNHL
ncbi:rho GTPase-activating protein 40-like isoform X2 [Tachypleus tridentatus]|uniref:rho GTPase-activating protein 40-like isoform X2 n=1 Tax=Tachypleus tridentatus TaxID=6853 RepID=UPI003FD0BA95